MSSISFEGDGCSGSMPSALARKCQGLQRGKDKVSQNPLRNFMLLVFFFKEPKGIN